MALIRRIISLVLTLALVGYLAYFLFRNQHTLLGVLQGTVWHVLGIGVCIVLTWVSVALQVQLPLRGMGYRIGFWENLAATLTSTLGNYTPVRAGTILRLRYFKRVHGIGYTRFVGVMGVRALMMMVTAGLLGTVGSIGLLLQGHQEALIVLWFFLAPALAGIGLFLVPTRLLPSSSSRIGKLLHELAAGADLLRSRPRFACLYLLPLLSNFATLSAELYLSFDVVGVRIPPYAYLLLGPATAFTLFISLTPGNLGLRETLIAALGAASGIDYNLGMYASAVDRALMLILIVVIGSVGMGYVLLRSEYPSLWERLVGSPARSPHAVDEELA